MLVAHRRLLSRGRPEDGWRARKVTKLELAEYRKNIYE